MKTLKARGAIISCLSKGIIPEVILIYSTVFGKMRGMTGLFIYALVVTKFIERTVDPESIAWLEIL